MLVFLACWTSPLHGGEHRKKKTKIVLHPEALHVAFISGRNEFTAVERGGSLVRMSYPDMELVGSFAGDSEREIVAIETSKNGEWLAAFYKRGDLWVWKTDSQQEHLKIATASRDFKFHPTKERLVIYQPKIGVTVWDLDARSRIPPIAKGGTYYLRDADGRPIRRYGFYKRDFSSKYVLENDQEFRRILSEIRLFGSPCRPLGDGRRFCRDISSIALTEEPTPEQIREHPTSPYKRFPGTYLWEIRVGKRIHSISSADISDDQRWVIVGANRVELHLFDTSILEPIQTSRILTILGGAGAATWARPALVKSVEIP